MKDNLYSIGIDNLNVIFHHALSSRLFQHKPTPLKKKTFITQAAFCIYEPNIVLVQNGPVSSAESAAAYMSAHKEDPAASCTQGRLQGRDRVAGLGLFGKNKYTVAHEDHSRERW